MLKNALNHRDLLRQWLPLVGVLAVLGGFGLAMGYQAAADDAKPPVKVGRKETGEPIVKQLVKPKNWPAGHPLPLVGSNCAACHLTAGRELTAAVINFTRSVHDLQEMTCYDCHGGNTRDDVAAHEEKFGFIGTKKSAHIATCSGCHTEAAEALAAGPHQWDFSKKINTEYPMCFDCHGNHDIGNPPADFKLAAMCADCHDKPAKEFPQLASVVAENDRLWEVLRKVHKQNLSRPENPVPEKFRPAVDKLRGETMQLVHRSQEISPQRAAEINRQAEALRTDLEKWLQSKP
ncbi:MAG TPA: cytochrome c3 family protein [Pirellulales bacterium]|jgi:formate-dependent nitrite reductase cytochrome c552 subunit|nr:cytochrome c3 family protein [Pirellulales bacterium]